MNLKEEKRIRRHKRIRSTISGTASIPRVTVSKSNTDLFVQIIDDVDSKTLVSISTKTFKGKKTEQSREAGKQLGEKAKKLVLKKLFLIEEVIYLQVE
ncbi:Ribosomal protein L18/L5 [sediment metagenome]|uniref:Ribosomal protein L18/L5 n=1 Tax=sediment metagenome TaxID=749907 RepID=D9PHB0_9ZZZZ